MPTDWRDNLLPASIGGADLFVSDVRLSTGRRVVVTELPKRDKPVNEDMGRRARGYSVTGFVIGAEYMSARDAVVKVLEGPGPYVFVHPWQGPKSVVLDGAVEVVESDLEGGWARISFPLRESGEPDGLRVQVSTSSALASATTVAIAAGAGDLAKGLEGVSLGSTFAAATGAVGKVSSQLMSAKRKVFGALGVAELSSLTDAITDLKDAAQRLINSPAALMSAISGLVATLMSVIAAFDGDDATFPGGSKLVRAEAALDAAQELVGVDTVTPPPFPGGPVDEAAQEAEAAVGKALKVATVTSTASLFQTLPLESADTAKTALAAVAGMSELLLRDPTTSDELFVGLTDMKAALDRHLAGLASTLPSVQEYTPAVTTPALLIAWQIYGDPTRDLEIVGRNSVRDPNFVRGGAPLQVLDG